MKSFSRGGYRIGRAPADVKWIYTFFLIFLLTGFATIGGYEFRQIGFHPQAVEEHYRGGEEEEGPEVEEAMAFAKPFSSLLETTHFHAFIMGIIYMTLAHLFIATETPRNLRTGIVVAAFIFTFLDLLLPWAVRYLSGAFAPVLLVSWIGEWVSYLFMIFASLYDLWLRPVPVLELDEEA